MNYLTKIKEAINYYRYLYPIKHKINNNEKIISVFSSPRGGST